MHAPSLKRTHPPPHAHAHTHVRTHARMHALTHTHTHAKAEKELTELNADVASLSS